MEIKITKAVPDDAYQIQDVYYKTWLTTYQNEKFGITKDDIENRFKDRHNPEIIESRKEKIKNLSDNSLFLVAKDKDKVVGVCRVITEERNQLGSIYVFPEYQGKGIGKMFWQKALNFFDTNKDIFVQVVVYNTNTIEFYKKLGFVDTGERFIDKHFTMTSGTTLPEMEMVIKANKK